MPGRLPASGSISIGDASGADSSINALRNIKRSTTTNSEMAMSTLRDWFRSYVDGAGDPSDNFPGAGDAISFSDFYNLIIFGVQIELQNETSNQYNNANNGKLRINGINGTEDFSFNFNGSTQEPTGTADVEYTSLNSGNYTLTCTDSTTSAEFTLAINIGYGGTASKITGTTTAGGDGTVYTSDATNGGGYSSTLVIYIEDPDPSGTAYGD